MDKRSFLISSSDKTSERDKRHICNDSFLSNNYEIYSETNLLSVSNNNNNHDRNSTQEQNLNGKVFLKNRNLLLEEIIAIQNKNYPVWRIKDAKFLGPFVKTSFAEGSEELGLFSSNFVDVREDCERVYVFQLEEKGEKCEGGEEGVDALDKILKIDKKMNLRALGCKMNISLKMKSCADVNIILRSTDKMDNDEAYIISYRKEGYGEYMRLFQCIGCMNDLSSFIYLKKSEVPLLNLDQESIRNDELNIKIEIFDYGDSSIKLKCFTGFSVMDKPFKLTYNNLLKPYFNGFNPYFIGNNGPVFIKSVEVELFDRKERETMKLIKKKSMCNKCNCLVF